MTLCFVTVLCCTCTSSFLISSARIPVAFYECQCLAWNFWLNRRELTWRALGLPCWNASTKRGSLQREFPSCSAVLLISEALSVWRIRERFHIRVIFIFRDLDAISEKIQDSCEIERNNALVEDEEEENEEEAEETTQWIVVNNEVIPKSSYLESCMDSEVPGPSHADSCAEREESCPVPAQESAVAESGYASDDIDCPEPIAIFGDTATIIKQEPVESVTEVKPSSGRKRKKPQWLDTYQTNFSKKSKLDVDAKKGEEHLVEGKPLSDEEEYLRNCLRQLWFRPIGTLIPEEDIKKEPDLALPDSSQPGSDGQADVASFGMPVISEVYSESASYGLPSSSSVAEKGRGHRKVNGAHSRKAVKVNGKNLRLRNRRNSKKSDHTDRNKSVSVSRVDRSTATVKRKTRASKTASKNGKENASKAKNGPKASLKMQSLGSVVERKQLRSKVKVPHWLKNYSADVSPLRRSKTQVQSRRSSNRKWLCMYYFWMAGGLSRWQCSCCLSPMLLLIWSPQDPSLDHWGRTLKTAFCVELICLQGLIDYVQRLWTEIQVWNIILSQVACI